MRSYASITLDNDTISAAAGGVGAVIALVAAWIAGRGARDAREAVKEARAPRLTTTEAPQLVNAHRTGAVEVKFTARNEGNGPARIVSYAVRDALDAPAHEARVTELADPRDRSLAGLMVAPANYGEFGVAVGPQSRWFHDAIRDRRGWALEIVYTDVAADDRTCTRFGVVPDDAGGWSLSVPRHETRSL